ncbi:MAG: penicillin-binding protein activator [Casimicrobiaceae bacterium]
MPIAAATPHPRFVRALLMAALLALPAAFSAAQVPPATESATRAEGVAPKRVDKPQLDIALVLPLEAPAYALAADAVRSGFLAAADAAGASARCVVIGHGEGGVIAAFETARSAAKVVVGPLVRDDLKVIAGANLELPWTIALNHLEDGAPLSPQIYTFALTIDSDARLLSRRMRDTGAQNIAVISGETPFLQRFAGAFATEWLLAGGGAPNAFRFDASPPALASFKRELDKLRGTKRPDAVLLALNGANAARLKPYLGSIASFASALAFDRPSDSEMRDLDGLVVAELPWLVTPDAAAFAQLPRREFGSAALERLYGFGLDAFNVAQAFRAGPPTRFSLDGATGVITLVEGQQFAREGQLAVFRGGQLVPLLNGR